MAGLTDKGLKSKKVRKVGSDGAKYSTPALPDLPAKLQHYAGRQTQ